VFELRSPVEAERLPRSAACLGWRTPLDPSELDAIAQWARVHGGASIRLHGAAMAQLDAVLDAVPVVSLELDATRIADAPRYAHGVRELVLRGMPHRTETLSSFSGVRTLRLDARGETVEVRALEALPALRCCSIASASLRGCVDIKSIRTLAALELVRTRVDAIDPLLRHPGIVALRLANVERVTSLEALSSHAVLRSLAIESLLHLESLQPIATLQRLETLAIRGLWQFNVGDARFVGEMRGLRALSLDIGGARKNVEITRRLGLPEPLPFDVGNYDLTTSYECGVQSVPAYLSSVTTVGAVEGLAGENGGV
jgi:hypothetical protein